MLSAEAKGELLKKAVSMVASGDLWLDHLTIKNILAQAMSVKKSVTRQESEIAETPPQNAVFRPCKLTFGIACAKN